MNLVHLLLGDVDLERGNEDPPHRSKGTDRAQVLGAQPGNMPIPEVC